MKKVNKILLLVFSVLLICSLLIGCTPKPVESSGEVTLPGLHEFEGSTGVSTPQENSQAGSTEDGTFQEPLNDTAQGNADTPEMTEQNGVPSPSPAAVDSDTQPFWDSENAALTTSDPAEQQNTPPSEDPIEDLDDDGLEVVDEFTFEVGDDFGVGGN